jgi:hypothetical protein
LHVGEGHEEEPLPDVRSTDARSAQIRRSDGVTLVFQVSRNSVEPREAVRTRNLLSKDDWREALADEPEPVGPEVPIVREAPAPPGRAEGLTGTGSGPNRRIVGPPGEAEGVGPDTNSGEEVTLLVFADVACAELSDAAIVNAPSSNVPTVGEVSEPFDCIWFDLVVED